MNNIFISVIMPFHNAASTLKKCLDSIENQSLNKSCFEVILIDNNSNDESVNIANDYKFKLLFEKDKQSSYAARNLGLKYASGNLIAFIDADCMADRDWLKNAYSKYQRNWETTDLIAGEIEIQVIDSNNPWEQYDKKVFLKQEGYVKNGKAATANLFSKKRIFQDIGNFQEVISGADNEWSNRAVKNGFNLEYDNNIKVLHPSRKSFQEIYTKSIRIEMGKSKLEKRTTYGLFKRFILIFFIPKYISLAVYMIKKKLSINKISELLYGFLKIRIGNYFTYKKYIKL